MSDTISKPAKDDFHRERSRFLDAFADLEEALHRIPTPHDKRLADELRSLRAIRNDLVHSRFRFVQLDGHLQAVAINTQEASTVARQVRLLKVEDFAQLLGKIQVVQRPVGRAA